MMGCSVTVQDDAEFSLPPEEFLTDDGFLVENAWGSELALMNIINGYSNHNGRGRWAISEIRRMTSTLEGSFIGNHLEGNGRVVSSLTSSLYLSQGMLKMMAPPSMQMSSFSYKPVKPLLPFPEIPMEKYKNSHDFITAIKNHQPTYR
ncbi:hypothetical protein F2Q68_00023672 [Brassica cretica]|uniref:Uncharacterized protein n=1 Tax=Brassica cretica TaxID=69181 RepID=A0A8S9I739_BRACR|nr:hypothetical protein F2Q68_00023672 [Brassica cretica]